MVSGDLPFRYKTKLSLKPSQQLSTGSCQSAKGTQGRLGNEGQVTVKTGTQVGLAYKYMSVLVTIFKSGLVSRTWDSKVKEIVAGSPPEMITQTVCSQLKIFIPSHLGLHSGIWGSKYSTEHLDHGAFKVKKPHVLLSQSAAAG